MMKVPIILGVLCTVISIGTGVFGAHEFEGKLLDKYMLVWGKAVNYQVCHGLGLILIGIISGTTSTNANWVGWLPPSGIVLFSGSLHIFALTQTRILGAITPTGGILFIVGWLMLIIAAFKSAGQLYSISWLVDSPFRVC